MLIAIALFVSIDKGYAKNYEAVNISYQVLDTIPDTAQAVIEVIDSLANDTTVIDSLSNIADKPERMESSFKSKVIYHGDDSIMIDNRNNKAYLWGNAWVKYEDIELQADYLEIDFAKNEVHATGMPDSNGVIKNMPVFKEKGKEYESFEMVYNFHTKKGLISKITTQESNGYIHGKTVKMASQDVFYIRDGRYTTCNLDHPHYYIKSKKLKIINNDKIVTGPAYLAVGDVPTFLAVPFGFFPNQDERTSGILVPSMGTSDAKGFSLNDGGYYFGFSDQFDLALKGDVYTNGSWSGRAIANYNQRYKRHGTLGFSYTNSKTGFKDTPNFIKTEAFFLDWSHTQDVKARPNSDFSAIVRLGSSNYFQNDLNTNDNNYLRNEFSSNITFSQRFARSPFSLKVNAGHNQNNQDSTFYVKLPEVAVNMSRIFPFKRKVKVGRDKWYEKVGVTYSGNFKNDLKTTFDKIGTSDNLKNMRNGVKHNINTSTSIKLGHINMSPGISYGETWYFKSVTQSFDSRIEYDEEGNAELIQDVVKDTTNGFYRFGDLNLNLSFNTKLYGMFAFRGKNLKAIRHTLTPSVSFVYKPDLSQSHPSYFGTTYTDTVGNTINYTVFDGSVYGTPNGSEIGRIGFGLQNVLEMKHKKRNDTTDKFTNTKLIDAWNFNTSYNMLADSFNWSPLTMRINARIGKNIIWSTNTSSDFYGITYYKKSDENGEVYAPKRSREFHYNLSGFPLRLTKFETSLGLKFSGQSTSTEEEKKAIKNINQPIDPNAPYIDAEYLDFNIPWSFNINYVFTYFKPLVEDRIVNSLTFNGSINITPGWKIRMRSSYDFDQNALGYTSMDIVRDLHCWQIDLNVIPFGDRKSFRVNIKVKQGFLQDLKLTKNNRWFDG